MTVKEDHNGKSTLNFRKSNYTIKAILFRRLTLLHRAGGGGTSDTRKAKIKEKNEKLHVKRQNDLLKKKEGEGDGAESRDVHDGMHPSRRAQIGV